MRFRIPRVPHVVHAFDRTGSRDLKPSSLSGVDTKAGHTTRVGAFDVVNDRQPAGVQHHVSPMDGRTGQVAVAIVRRDDPGRPVTFDASGMDHSLLPSPDAKSSPNLA